MNTKTLLVLPLLLTASLSYAVEIHGHRGARAAMPENTLAAFSYALDAGVDVLEMDMQVTKDNKIVISHEPRIAPEICLGPNGETIKEPPVIHELTLEQVKKYDCGTLQNPKFKTQTPVKGEKIPTLDEVFELVEKSTAPAAKNVRFNIETKIYPFYPQLSPAPEDFVKLAAEVINRHNMSGRVIIQSFDDRTLQFVRKYMPLARTAMLVSDNHLPLVSIAKALMVDIISPDYMWILPEDVEALHDIGVQVVPWTVDTPADWDRMLALGVDGIISDDPQGLIKYLSDKK